MLFTIQVSNHPRAGERICPNKEVGDSWETVYDGRLAGGSKDAKLAVDRLSNFYRHARVFRGNKTAGKLYYAVLRMG